jgi:hypothetical protein
MGFPRKRRGGVFELPLLKSAWNLEMNQKNANANANNANEKRNPKLAFCFLPDVWSDDIAAI